MTQLDELESYFYTKGLTFSRDEIIALVQESASGDLGPATTDTVPASDSAGKSYTFNAGGTYAHFLDNTATAITIPAPPAGQAIVNGRLYSTGTYWLYSYSLVAVPDANIPNGGVTPAKTSFFQPAKNLFNLATATAGFFVNPANGTLNANASYQASDYIAVLPATAYARTNQYQLAFYNSSKVYISGLSTFAGTPDTFTTPAGAAYVRVSMKNTDLNTYQLELGTVSTTYAAYQLGIQANYLPALAPADASVTAAKLAGKAVTPDKTNFFITGKNLFSKAAAISGYYPQPASGTLLANASYSTSDFIAIDPSTNYARTNQHFTAFYDIAKNYISGLSGNTAAADTFTSPAGAAYIRVGLLTSELNTYQLEAGTVSTTYEAYSQTILPKYVPAQAVADGSITPAALAPAAVVPSKTSFVRTGKNLFNVNAADVSLGAFINYATGAINTSASYNATGFIPVIAGAAYTLSKKTHLAWYTANKVYISGSNSTDTNATQTAPAGAAYLRSSVQVANWSATAFQVEAGNVATAIVPYQYKLKSDDGVGFDLSDWITFAPTVEVVLAYIDFAVIGVEKNIYFRNIIFSPSISLSDLDIDVTCSKGQQFKDFYRFSAIAGDVGTYPFSITVYYNGVAIASATSSIVVVAAVTATVSRKVLMIGDSTLAGAQVLNPALNDFTGNGFTPVFIGTKGTGLAKHEGQSGYKASDYATVGRTLYRFNLTGVTIAPGVNSIYANNGSTFTVVEVNMAGATGYINCTLTTGTNTPISGASTIVKTSGTGDTSINYTSSAISTGNPFWNTATGQFDFQNYLSTNSFTMSTGDMVAIHLGINDCFGFTDDAGAIAGAATFIAQLDTIINGCKAAVPGLKFGVCLMIAPSASQDAFGASYGTGKTLKRYERNRHIFNKAVAAYYGTAAMITAGIYLVSYHSCTDTVNNYQAAAASPVNARNTAITISRPNNGVHPADPGYYQMGDVLYSFFKYAG